MAQKRKRAKAKANAIYDKRARLLKGAGIALSYKLGRTNNDVPQRKSAVTRAWKEYRLYLNPRKGTVPVKFVKATKRELRTVRKFYSPEAITKGGFFIQPPKGVALKDYKVSVNTKRQSIEVRTPRKKVFDEIIEFKTKSILRNPEKAIADSLKGLKNVRHVVLMVNGFQGKNTYSVAEMKNYFKHRLVAELREEYEEEGKRLTSKAIADIFQLKVIHGAPAKKSAKKNRRR